MDRSPRHDKDRDLARQSVGGPRQAVRRQQHADKERVHRRYRRVAAQALAQAGTLADDVVAERAQARIAATRRATGHRWDNPPMLADHVTERLVERFLDMLDTFSAGPYRSAAQRARTERALEMITRARPPGRRLNWVTRVTLELDVLLPVPVLPGHPRYGQRNTGRRREWFHAFLADTPEWEPRLVRWIADRAP